MEISGKFLKLLGLCLIGGVGGCAILVPSLNSDSSSSGGSETKTETPQLTEEQRKAEATRKDLDRKSKFMYRLSKKVFRFLKDKKKGGADQKENVVKGLKDKFNGSLENEEDTWENFKSLCDEQQTKETKNAPNVNKEEFRLCIMERFFPLVLKDSKGNLHRGKDADEYKDLGFDKWPEDLPNIALGGGPIGISISKSYSELEKNMDAEFDKGYKRCTLQTSSQQTGIKISDFFATDLDKGLSKPGFEVGLI